MHETPEEIQRIASGFKANGMDNVVTSENDFLLGTVISFIYYKFMLYCVFQGNAITEMKYHYSKHVYSQMVQN